MTGDRTIVALEEPGPTIRRAGRLRSGKDLGRIGPIDHDYDLAAPSPDGRLLAVRPRRPECDLPLGRRGRPGESPVRQSTRRRLRSFAFSPDSRYLASDRANGAIEIRDLVTDAVRTVTAPVSEPNSLTFFAFSPDSRYLATSVVPGVGKTQPTTIWQLDPWRQVATYPGELGPADLFLFSRTGGR